jgi:hypothetical protein
VYLLHLVLVVLPPEETGAGTPAPNTVGATAVGTAAPTAAAGEAAEGCTIILTTRHIIAVRGPLILPVVPSGWEGAAPAAAATAASVVAPEAAAAPARRSLWAVRVPMVRQVVASRHGTHLSLLLHGAAGGSSSSSTTSGASAGGV